MEQLSTIVQSAIVSFYTMLCKNVIIQFRYVKHFLPADMFLEREITNP